MWPHSLFNITNFIEAILQIFKQPFFILKYYWSCITLRPNMQLHSWQAVFCTMDLCVGSKTIIPSGVSRFVSGKSRCTKMVYIFILKWTQFYKDERRCRLDLARENIDRFPSPQKYPFSNNYTTNVLFQSNRLLSCGCQYYWIYSEYV